MYGSLTKVLMGDLTEKYICMVEVGDVIFPTNVVTKINKSIGNVIRFDFGKSTFVISNAFTNIVPFGSITEHGENYTPLTNHMLYDVGHPVTISHETRTISFT
jgi:hypothetical protein